MITFFIALLITRNTEISAMLGIVDNGFKILSYYLFDIMWNRMTTKKYNCSVVWLTGLSSSGKTTISNELIKKLRDSNQQAMLLDGDEIREIFKNQGFSKEDRIKHNVEVAKMASFLINQGIIPIVSLISPHQEARDKARSICNNKFVEVFISTPLNVCEKRDVKGLYKKARLGEVKNFTGIHKSSPYEIPNNPEIVIDTTNRTVKSCVNDILKYLIKNK